MSYPRHEELHKLELRLKLDLRRINLHLREMMMGMIVSTRLSVPELMMTVLWNTWFIGRSSTEKFAPRSMHMGAHW